MKTIEQLKKRFAKAKTPMGRINAAYEFRVSYPIEYLTDFIAWRAKFMLELREKEAKV